MSPKIIVLRILARLVITLTLIVAVTLGLFWMKEGIALPETNEALIGLIGVISAGLLLSLKDMTGSMARNSSDIPSPSDS